jgi:hypothetical protein
MRVWVAVLTGLAAVSALGCAGKNESTGNAGASSFTSLELATSGSGVSSPVGAPCDLTTFTSTFNVSTSSRTLTWDLCALNGATVEHQTGSYSLEDADLESINDAVGALKPSTQNGCGGDYPAITLDETTSEGVQLLADDFYSGCPWGRLLGRTFVQGLGDLNTVLYALKDK